jgi:putative ABC transport system ATP-binding protein
MISLNHIRFQYPVGAFSLSIPELQVSAGETVAIIGPSGSGKTTLLNLIAGILLPDAGQISTAGIDIGSLPDTELRSMRLAKLGLVFQEFELLEYLPVHDNILLPYRLGNSLKLTTEVQQNAARLAARMGIADKLKSYPEQLSQGERQRVALCRALVTQPEIILADEPTGNLDPTNKGLAMDFLFDYVREHDAALITVTHDHQLVERFDRVINFQDFMSQNPVDAGAGQGGAI